jgi:hypothetical protein
MVLDGLPELQLGLRVFIIENLPQVGESLAQVGDLDRLELLNPLF